MQSALVEIWELLLYPLWAFSWPLQSSKNNRAVYENGFCLGAEAGKKYIGLGV